MMMSKRAKRGVVIGVLGVGAALGGASCLRVNEDHCLFDGGDAACGERFCVAAVEGGADALASVKADGCIDEVPRDAAGAVVEGVAYARYGLVDEARRDEILRREGVDLATCPDMPTGDELTGDIVDDLRARGRARRKLAALSTEDRDRIHALNDSLEERIAVCGGGEPTTGSTTEGVDTTEGTTAGSESTTGPGGCVEDVECMDVERPLCGPQGQCVPCFEVGAPSDARCAAKALTLGTEDVVCAKQGPRAGQCVECTEEAPEACTGVPSLCEVETNTCQPCEAHEQCGQASCNFFTGECLPEDAVVHVGPGLDFDFETLGDAVGSIGEGGMLTAVVHQGTYDEAVTVSGGRVVVFRAAEGEPVPVWALIGVDSPQLTVEDATVVLEGLQLSQNAATAHPAVRVTGGKVRVDRGRVIGNDGGGVLAEEGAEVVLRNSFLGGSVSDVDVLSIQGSSLEMVYTTVGAGGAAFRQARALSCSSGADVTVRNSILVSLDDVPELACDGATVSNTATETAVVGPGNQTLGSVEGDWFTNYTSGDFHLRPMAPAALETTAQWSPGDPLEDIDGDPRPDTEDAPDYAGADVP